MTLLSLARGGAQRGRALRSTRASSRCARSSASRSRCCVSGASADLAGCRCRRRRCLPSNALTPTMMRSPRSISRCWRSRRARDLALEVAGLDAGHDAAERVDLLEDLLGLALQPVGQRLDEVRARQRIDRVRRRPSRTRGSAACAARCAPTSRSAARASRPSSWCAATACRRAPRPSPGRRRARCCSRAAARPASRRRSARACAAATTPASSRRTRRACRFAQMRRAARNFAISSKKSLCTSKKNERRGAKSSTSRPRAMPRSTYSKPLRSVNASSCAAVEPASRMW